MKIRRHSEILKLVQSERVGSQEALRSLLRERGFDVAQATLSRDIQDLGLVKARDEDGELHYTPPSPAIEPHPALDRLIPALYVGHDGVDNLIVMKTLAGGAQPLGAAIDAARWPEIVGTVAGDDAILIILRKSQDRATFLERFQKYTKSQ